MHETKTLPIFFTMSFTPLTLAFRPQCVVLFFFSWSAPPPYSFSLCLSRVFFLSLHLCRRAPVTQRALPKEKFDRESLIKLKELKERQGESQGERKGQHIKGSNKRRALTVLVFSASFFPVLFCLFSPTLRRPACENRSLHSSFSLLAILFFHPPFACFLPISLRHILQHFWSKSEEGGVFMKKTASDSGTRLIW